MEIFLLQNEQQAGPFSVEDVGTMLASGDLAPTDLGWHEGLAQWQPLNSILEIGPQPSILAASPAQEAPQPVTTNNRRGGIVGDSKRRLARYVFVGGLLVVVLYLVSPYYSLWRLRGALKSGDRNALESRIDFPSVRESLKDQLRIQMATSLAKDGDLKNNPFGGLAAAAAPMMVNYVIDNLVTPSGISALIANSKSALSDSDESGSAKHTPTDIDWSKVHHIFFTGPTRFMVDMDGTKLHFSFTDFSWKLKEIEIPEDSDTATPAPDTAATPISSDNDQSVANTPDANQPAATEPEATPAPKYPALDEKNGFRNFRLGSPFSDFASVKLEAADSYSADEKIFDVQDFDKKIGNAELSGIRLIFSQNLLKEIVVFVSGELNEAGLKEALITAYGQPETKSTTFDGEQLVWQGDTVKLVFEGGMSWHATFTNMEVDGKIEEIIQDKAKAGAATGAKGL